MRTAGRPPAPAALDITTAPASGKIGSVYPSNDSERGPTQYPKCIFWSCFVVPSGLVLSTQSSSKEDKRSARHITHSFIKWSFITSARAAVIHVPEVRPNMHYPVTVVPLDVSRACSHAITRVADRGLALGPRPARWFGAGLKCHSSELGQGTPLPHEGGLVVTRELSRLTSCRLRPVN